MWWTILATLWCLAFPIPPQLISHPTAALLAIWCFLLVSNIRNRHKRWLLVFGSVLVVVVCALGYWGWSHVKELAGAVYEKQQKHEQCMASYHQCMAATVESDRLQSDLRFLLGKVWRTALARLSPPWMRSSL